MNGSIKMADSKYFKTRSQENEDYFHDAGQFYWANSSLWLSKRIFESEGKPIFLERFRVHDIDTEDDWIRAEQIFQYSKIINNRKYVIRTDASIKVDQVM